MRFFLACFTSSNSLPAIASSNLPTPSPKNSKHRNSIPGSELLERLLVVGIVGIDIASEPASRDGEGGALDGLLHEERPLGRAGERSGARASCAADEGGDGHCEGGGVGRSGDEESRVGYYSCLSCLLGWAGYAEVQTTTHWKLSGWTWHVGASTCHDWSETSGFAYNHLVFGFMMAIVL